jgi:hypothetical protein
MFLVQDAHTHMIQQTISPRDVNQVQYVMRPSIFAIGEYFPNLMLSFILGLIFK